MLEIFPETNKVLTTTSVKEELLDGNDELSKWIKKQPSDYFIEPDIEIQRKLRKIATFVKSNYTKPGEVEKFMGKADPWLIATAMQHKCKIVTHEVLVKGPTHKIKIPNIAIVFGVQCISIFELLRHEKVSFGLR